MKVKCPYSARNYTVQEAIKNNVKYFLLIQKGEDIKLNTNNHHFYQIQGQLFVTGIEFCDFIVFTKGEIFVKRIRPHRDTMLNILKK